MTECHVIPKVDLYARQLVHLQDAQLIPYTSEFAELGALYGYLRKHTIDFNQILLWAKQIAMGMNYLHYEAPVPVIHRDLKSKNGE